MGELFDNMYLTELKNGRCTPPDAMHADFDRYSELSRRNSRQPPHLRTNYMALAPDCIPPQDDTGVSQCCMSMSHPLRPVTCFRALPPPPPIHLFS